MKTNQIILLLASVLLIDSCSVEAKKIQHGIVGFANEYMEVVGNVKQLEKKNKRRPRAKSVLYDVFMNLKTLVYNPSFVNFLTVFIDYSSYIIMPAEGGYSATNAHQKYLEDQYAYIDAGITEDFLFVETTNLFKEKFWQFFGMFERVSQTTGIEFFNNDEN